MSVAIQNSRFKRGLYQEVLPDHVTCQNPKVGGELGGGRVAGA